MTNKRRIAHITKKRLITIIATLIVILAALIIEPGREMWPAWLIAIKKPLLVLLGPLTILTILMSPIIVVTESDPRSLSGVGASPHQRVFNHWDRD